MTTESTLAPSHLVLFNWLDRNRLKVINEVISKIQIIIIKQKLNKILEGSMNDQICTVER